MATIDDMDRSVLDDIRTWRAAIVLVHVEGLTVKEAAETLGTTEGAMEQRLLRARAAIRKKEKKDEVNNG